MFNLRRPTPDSIVERFIAKARRQQSKHLSEIDRLQTLIDDATARLTNHRIAADALNNMLRPLDGVILLPMDIDPHTVERANVRA